MNRGRASNAVLRLYPSSWRARYGDELRAVLSASGNDWRDLADVAASGVRERVRNAWFPSNAPQQARSGSLLVLWAWLFAVVGGIAVQKTSEHWQSSTTGTATTAQVGFDILVGAALAGSVLLVVGVALTLPSVIPFLRRGGWPSVRRPVIAAVVITAAAIGALLALVVSARGLSSAERNGHDLSYAILVSACALLGTAALGSWVTAATAIGCRIELSPRLLNAEASLATAVAVSIIMIATSAALWVVAIASAVPGFLTTSSKNVLIVALAMMGTATLLAVVGSVTAVRGAMRVRNGTA